jgi:hypothetical protein
VLISAGVFLGLMGEQWREPERASRDAARNRSGAFGPRSPQTATRSRVARTTTRRSSRSWRRTSTRMRQGRPERFGQYGAMTSGISRCSSSKQPGTSHRDAGPRLHRCRPGIRPVTPLHDATGYVGTQRAIVQSTIYGQSWKQVFSRRCDAFHPELHGRCVQYFDPRLLKS